MTPNFNDDDLEQELRFALRRIEPSRDFSMIMEARRPVRYWLAWAAALVVAVSIPVGVRYREQQIRRQRAEEARAQLITALRITESKLQKTQRMVARELNRRKIL
jgi:hypothetical protein